MLRSNPTSKPPPLPAAARRQKLKTAPTRRVLGVPRDSFAGAIASRLLEAGERFRAGDYHRAILVAMRLLDDEPVPALAMSATELSEAPLDAQEQLFIGLIDGHTLLDEVIESVGLGILEGIDVVTRLAAAGVISMGSRRASA